MEETGDTRRYRMSDASLIQRADALIHTLTRDQNELAVRNISPARIQALQQARDAFDGLPTDVEERSVVSMAATAKRAARLQLERSLRLIRSMAHDAFGNRGYYEVFGFDNITNLTDGELIRCGRRVVRVCNRLQSRMEASGLTPALVTALNDQIRQLETAFDNLDAAEEIRDLKTQARVRAGNALYEQITQLARAGQSVFADTDPARYNDYRVEG